MNKLIKKYRNLDIEFALDLQDSSKLKIRGSKHRVRENLAEIKLHKEALIHYLKQQSQFKMSTTEKAIWNECQADKNKSIYNLACGLSIKFDIDLEKLKSAAIQLSNCHTILRQGIKKNEQGLERFTLPQSFIPLVINEAKNADEKVINTLKSVDNLFT
ncbi:MAG: hypothetical protein H6618_00210 [Deltaproteobacteria bacterium]|nr:hypothetical protein [Deltaproteobacteria bacterium]